jgi:hypothetical protein
MALVIRLKVSPDKVRRKAGQLRHGFARDSTEKHADQHRHKCQQHTPAPKRQQQQQQNADRCPAANPGHFARRLLLTVGRVKQTAGGQ